MTEREVFQPIPEATRMLDVLRGIDDGKLEAEFSEPLQAVFHGHATVRAAGWEIVVFVDAEDWDYLDSVTSPEGVRWEFPDGCGRDIPQEVMAWEPQHRERWGLGALDKPLNFGSVSVPADRQGLPSGLVSQLKEGLFGLDALARQAANLPPALRCSACETEFYVFGREGIRTPPNDEACPTCSPKWTGPTGGESGVDVEQVETFIGDCLGMQMAADTVVRETGDPRPEVMRTLQSIEQTPEFQEWHRAVLAAEPNRSVAWVTALRLYVDGPVAARADPLAAEVLARKAGLYLDPKDVKRIVVKVGGKTKYMGAIAPEAGRMLRLMARHGRKMVVTCHMKDGTKRRYRGNGERIE